MCNTLPPPSPSDATRRPGAINAFVDDLVVTLTHYRFYGIGHPRVTEAAETVARGVRQEAEALDRPRLEIGAADGYLFFDQRPLLGASRSAPRLLTALERLGAGGISLGRGTTAEEVLALVRLVADAKGTAGSVEEANRHLQAEGCPSIAFLPGYDVREGPVGPGDTASEVVGGTGRVAAVASRHLLDVPVHLYRQVFDHLTDVTTDVLRGNSIRVDATQEHVSKVLEKLNEHSRGVLTAAHYRQTATDAFQFRHSIRMACLALHFSRHLTTDEDLLHRIGVAAMLHDVGKARVDYWGVLHAKGRFTEEQRRQMAAHPEHGADILVELAGGDPVYVAAALGHHRSLSGGGYPRLRHTLAEAQVSFATRIVRICDVYEALTAVREYRETASPVQAYRTMLSMGDAFDRSLLHRFILVNGYYPDGDSVELEGGAVGTVDSQTGDPERPRILVTGHCVPSGDGASVLPCEAVLRDPTNDPDMPRVVRWIGPRYVSEEGSIPGPTTVPAAALPPRPVVEPSAA